MEKQHSELLATEAGSKGLSVIPFADILAVQKSRSIVCCGGILEKIVFESAADTTVLLRDNTASIHCCIHANVTDTYPSCLEAGSMFLLRSVPLLVTNALPPMLIMCVENIVSLLVPESLDEAPSAAAGRETFDFSRQRSSLIESPSRGLSVSLNPNERASDHGCRAAISAANDSQAFMRDDVAARPFAPSQLAPHRGFAGCNDRTAALDNGALPSQPETDPSGALHLPSDTSGESSQASVRAPRSQLPSLVAVKAAAAAAGISVPYMSQHAQLSGQSSISASQRPAPPVESKETDDEVCLLSMRDDEAAGEEVRVCEKTSSPQPHHVPPMDDEDCLEMADEF